jgi:hypothetical protein
MWTIYSCIEANSIVIKRLFFPLPAALFHSVVGAFGTKTTKQ